MTATRLPDGFAVQVDRRVRVLGDGSALLGGSPTRLLRLAPAARGLLCDGRLKVRDEVSAELARILLDATVAHPRPPSGPSHRDVTVVIPVRNNASGLRRLVTSLRGLRVIVVDDGSACPVESDDFVGAHCDIEVLHHPHSKGAGRGSQHRASGLHHRLRGVPGFRRDAAAGMVGILTRPLLRSHRRTRRTSHRQLGGRREPGSSL